MTTIIGSILLFGIGLYLLIGFYVVKAIDFVDKDDMEDDEGRQR